MKRRFSQPDLLPVAAIIGIWVVMEVLINPRGNFPLNDDWWFAGTVRTLLADHKLVLPFGVSMSLVAHVLWGALFSSLFGFSFDALRLSTLVLGLAGVLVTYGLLREIGASRLISFVGALTVAVNPIYMELSNTFMTDVTFNAIALSSLYLFVRGLKRESKSAIIAATLTACIATLIRQIGITTAAAFGVAYLVKNGRRAVWIAVLPIALTSATLLGYQKWLAYSGNVPLLYGLQVKSAEQFIHLGAGKTLIASARFAEEALVYIGLFLLPILMLSLPRRSEVRLTGKYLLSRLPSLVLFLLLMTSLAYADKWMPLNKGLGNVLMDFQLGPVTLYDVFYIQLPNITHAPKVIWQIVTAAGAAGAALILSRVLSTLREVFRRKESSDLKWLAVLMMCTFAFYVIPLLILSPAGYFDRYLISLIAPLMGIVYLTHRPKKIGRVQIALAATVLLLFGSFGVAGTHDYLAWNRARWAAYSRLVQMDKVPVCSIQGGYECVGWSFAQRNWDWSREVDPAYAITFGLVDGYNVLRTYPIHNWLPYGQEEILVLKRVE